MCRGEGESGGGAGGSHQGTGGVGCFGPDCASAVQVCLCCSVLLQYVLIRPL